MAERYELVASCAVCEKLLEPGDAEVVQVSIIRELGTEREDGTARRVAMLRAHATCVAERFPPRVSALIREAFSQHRD